MTPEKISLFIRSVNWTFAKTMPQIPHWYTVKEWHPELAGDFECFVRHIQDNGYSEIFMGKSYKYFDVGEYKYWTMDPSVDETDLINRALVTVPTSEINEKE